MTVRIDCLKIKEEIQEKMRNDFSRSDQDLESYLKNPLTDYKMKEWYLRLHSTRTTKKVFSSFEK